MKVAVLRISCICLVVLPSCFPLPNQDKISSIADGSSSEDMSTDETVWPIWGPGLGAPGKKGGYYPQSWFQPPGFGNPYSGVILPPGGMVPGGTFSGPIIFPSNMYPQSGGSSSPYGGGGYNMG